MKYILFQIKRFLYIFYTDSFLFIKNKIKYFKNKTPFYNKKGVPNFNKHKEIEIKLDKEYYDFYTLQPKNNKPFYNKSLLFTLIQKHKIEIFNNLLKILELYNFKLCIGIELEFYIFNNKNNINIINEIKKILPQNYIIEEEKGNNQYELKTYPYTNIKLLTKHYIEILEKINKFCNDKSLIFNLSPTPLQQDCSSALQLNISILDNENNNLFARVKNNNDYTESPLMLNSIAGLLKNINNNLLLYINNENCLERFDIKRNIAIRDNNKYPAPTFISWGINNRSASIRIPTPPFIDLHKYLEEDKKNRRIEYRIPSSSADIYYVLIGVITGILDGIDNNLLPHIDKTSFDLLSKNEGFEKIETNISIINDIFKINNDYLFY